MDIIAQLRHVSDNLMGRKEVDGLDVNAVCADGAAKIGSLADALREIAEWYCPDGMGTANNLAGIAHDALEEAGLDPR